MAIKKIVKLTTFSFLGPFLATFFIVLFTLLMQFLWKYIDDMVGKGLEGYVIGELLFYASASFVPLALPLAILLSSIMSFGKLAESYELVALKSAGTSLIRIMIPMILVIILTSAGAFFFSNNVIPRANLKFYSLLWDVRQQRPALDIKPGVFYSGIDNYSIRIHSKDKKSSKIEGIMIYDHTRPGNNIVLTANHGEMDVTPDKQWLNLKLYDGNRYEEMDARQTRKQYYPASRLSFKSYDLKIDLSGFKMSRTNEDYFKDNYQMLNIAQLNYYQDSVGRIIHDKRKEAMDFSRPYFNYFKDTAFYRKANYSHTKNLTQGLVRSERREMVERAINTARTLKDDIYHNQAQEIENYNKLLWRYQIEWHRKFALSLACLTLFFIGAPLGAIIRKGGIGTPTVVSIAMFIIFYILTIVGEKSAKEGVVMPVTGMWLPTLVLMPIGFYLTHKANVDAFSFSFDRFRAFIRQTKKSISKLRNAHTATV